MRAMLSRTMQKGQGRGQVRGGEATEAIFSALSSIAPSILVELRDAPVKSDAVIDTWAKVHRLHAEDVLKFARGLVRWWDRAGSQACVENELADIG